MDGGSGSPATVIGPSWAYSTAVWLATLACDVGVVVWSSTWRIWHCQDRYGNFFPSMMLVLIMIGIPTAYALRRCSVHAGAEPHRRSLIRQVTTAIACAGAASAVAGILVLTIGDELQTSGVC